MTTAAKGETIRASDAVIELTKLYGPSPVSARRFHNMILDGKVPATRGLDGKFAVDRANLRAIAEILGMTATEAVA